MSDQQKKTKDFEDAVAKDWYAGIQNDLSQMSPGQLAVTQKALADFVAKKADHSEVDFNKKVARMSDKELRQLIVDADYDRQHKNG